MIRESLPLNSEMPEDPEVNVTSWQSLDELGSFDATPLTSLPGDGIALQGIRIVSEHMHRKQDMLIAGHTDDPKLRLYMWMPSDLVEYLCE
jgi:hypothetical protein